MRRTTHAATIRAIATLVDRLGGQCYVVGQRAVRGRGGKWYTPISAGVPDLFIQMPTPPGRTGYGPAFWFEVKVGKDVLRPAQYAFAERVVACGHDIHCGDLDDFLAALRGYHFPVEA